MHFEVLTEDRSGGVVVEALMDKILKPLLLNYSIAIRPHRGKGDMPDDPYAPPKKFASGLMDLLPAKLRAYDRVFAGTDFVLVVVMDSDSLFPDDVREILTGQVRTFAPGLRRRMTSWDSPSSAIFPWPGRRRHVSGLPGRKCLP